MAELGIVASTAQIADAGLRLSIKLCTFGEIVASADKSVTNISKDVSLASSVLKELGAIHRKDAEAKFLTEEAVKTTNEIVKECLQIFEEIEDIIIKKLPTLCEPDLEKASKAAVLLERLRWPYLQPKLQLWQSNLDRMKSTLLLMLNVISYAQQISTKSEPEHIIAYQRSLIEDLAQSNEEYIRRFQTLHLEYQTPSAESKISNNDVYGNSLVSTERDTKVVRPRKSETITDEQIPSRELQDLFKDNTNFAQDGRFTQLQDYLSMSTALLQETNLDKYSIEPVRRSRVRLAIYRNFNLEIDSLASLFEVEYLQRVKSHFKGHIINLSYQSYQHIYAPLSNSSLNSSYSSNDYASNTYSSGKEAMTMESTKPQCWDHGCNGRQFTTFSNLLKHQREKSGWTEKHACQRCGAEFTRKTARDGHLAHDNCKMKTVAAGEQEAPKSPQCWDHGCNGRQFPTYKDLLNHHSRGKSGSREKHACHRCGAEFTRKTARDGHLAHDKCYKKTVLAGEQGATQSEEIQPSVPIEPEERPFSAGTKNPDGSAVFPPQEQSAEPDYSIDSTVDDTLSKDVSVVIRDSIVDKLVALWMLPST